MAPTRQPVSGCYHPMETKTVTLEQIEDCPELRLDVAHYDDKGNCRCDS